MMALMAKQPSKAYFLQIVVSGTAMPSGQFLPLLTAHSMATIQPSRLLSTQSQRSSGHRMTSNSSLSNLMSRHSRHAIKADKSLRHAMSCPVRLSHVHKSVSFNFGLIRPRITHQTSLWTTIRPANRAKQRSPTQLSDSQNSRLTEVTPLSRRQMYFAYFKILKVVLIYI